MVGIAYYILNIDNNRKNQELALKNQEQVLKSRNASVFHNVIGQFLTNQQGIRNIQIVEDNRFTTLQEYSELWKNPEFRTAVTWLWTVYDTAGIYVKEGVVDIDVFAQYQPYWHLRFWNDFKEVVYATRKRTGPSFFRNMEYLMKRLIEYYEEHPELAP